MNFITKAATYLETNTRFKYNIIVRDQIGSQARLNYT